MQHRCYSRVGLVFSRSCHLTNKPWKTVGGRNFCRQQGRVQCRAKWRIWRWCWYGLCFVSRNSYVRRWYLMISSTYTGSGCWSLLKLGDSISFISQVVEISEGLNTPRRTLVLNTVVRRPVFLRLMQASYCSPELWPIVWKQRWVIFDFAAIIPVNASKLQSNKALKVSL